MTEFPHIRVQGTAAERGRQYGEQARERVRRSIDGYREVFAHYTGWDWDRVRREAARFEAPIAAFRPGYLDEIRGIAEGAGADPGDILAINVRTEVMFAATARQAAGQDPARDRAARDGQGPAARDGQGPAARDGQGPAARDGQRPAADHRPAECSAFAMVPAAADGPTLIGQNWDWLPHTSQTVVVLEARQDEGPDFVTVVEAGLLAKTGMNSSGIGLATNAMVTGEDAGAPGVPYHVALRAILDSETLSDALAALQQGPRSSAANYLIAHRDGIAVDVEAAPGDFARLFLLFPDAEDGVLLHTNHFLSQQFTGKDVSVWAMPDSPIRLQRLRAALRAATLAAATPPSLETFRALLSDHANYPSAACCHPDKRMHRYDQGTTVASVLMDLSAGQLWLADGPPCTTAYRKLDYREFLAKPSPVAATATVR